MTEEHAEQLLDKLRQNATTQNFIAQSSARHILFSVGEDVENFPNFRSNLDQGATSIAFSYISIGCFYAEREIYEKSIEPLRKGAELLEYCHQHEANKDQYSSFYVLISALAYYAASQYSKSFILLKNAEIETVIARIISLFLKKQFVELIGVTNGILLDSQFISSEDNLLEPNGKVYELLLAKSIERLLGYIYSGDTASLHDAKNVVDDLLEVAIIDGEPSVWWVARLLRIIIDRFGKYSLWNIIPPILPQEAIERKQVDKFILGLTFRKIPIVELFLTQEQAIQKINSKGGAVICLPTSSGKTRIAEIAILKCLVEYPESVVLFLAPFRSLAYELEESLNSTFEPLNYKTTYLYGGSQFGKIDQLLIEQSQIVVATPEKAKAIIRAESELKDRVKLVVIDEGHILDGTQRNVTNELFVEEMKYHVDKNGGKMLLLSAVLPNSEDVAQWIANDADSFIRSDWRPTTQKFGILNFTGENVDIHWKEKEPTCNKNFVKPFLLPKKRKPFPQKKKQAIAATAAKLSKLGSVLVFVGIAKSVSGYAKEISAALQISDDIHQWNNSADWKLFKLICSESLGTGSEIMRYAGQGIICHSRNSLPPEVRFAIEKLMRNGNPRVIISTSTLAQGVNLGVSSVIIATAWVNRQPIDSRTFMNIAGRAGRAFTDSEGKILYAIDLTQEDKPKVNREIRRAEKYFDSANIEPVQSGLLTTIAKIGQIAEKCNIDFGTLLEIIAENDFSKFRSNLNDNHEEEIKDYFDWIDDTLLSLSIEHSDFDTSSSSDWIDDHFRKSLAYIQAEQQDWTGDNLIEFLKARNSGVKASAGSSIHNWKSHISSGLPLRSAIYIDNILEDILRVTYAFVNSKKAADDVINLLFTIETLLSQLPSTHFRKTYKTNDIDVTIKRWITAAPISEIERVEKGLKICNDYLGYILPWVLNSIAKKLANLGNENENEALEQLAVLCEIGVPNFFAAKVYLAGIKSRIVATELSMIPWFRDILLDSLPSQINNFIVSVASRLKQETSELASKWIDVLVDRNNPQQESIQRTNIRLKTEVTSDILFVRSFDDNVYLCSSDFREKVNVGKLNVSPLSEFADNFGVYFERTQSGSTWVMKIKDPNLNFSSST